MASKTSNAATDIRVTPTTISTDDPAVAERQRIVDLAVRHARKQGYCEVFGQLMRKIMPDMIDEELNEPTDSDGRTCNEDEWRDTDGFNRNGLDRSGRNRDGFDHNGRDARGFDRDGLDSEGLSKDDPSRYQYDRHGTTQVAVLAQHAFVYDRNGRDIGGFDSSGYNTNGEYRRDRDSYYTPGR